MRITKELSENFFRDPVDWDLFLARSCYYGFETKPVETMAFQEVIIGRITSLRDHPKSTKLTICNIDFGEGLPSSQILCGADNLLIGEKVPVARLASIVGHLTIERRVIAGVESNGMICSAEELGLGKEEGKGILILPDDAPLGTDLADYLGLKEQKVADVEITHNRVDCHSVCGLSREIAFISDLEFRLPQVPCLSKFLGSSYQFLNQIPDLVQGYALAYFPEIDASISTPDFIRRGLDGLGKNSVSFIVDVLNYTMFLFGQPMHAFDCQEIFGSIVVRRAEQGEKITILTGKELTLQGGEIVIADQKGILALAGIIGGTRARVKDSTVSILVEAAVFQSESIASTLQKTGIRTDSALYFERGNLGSESRLALEFAANLIKIYNGSSEKKEFGLLAGSTFVSLERRKISFSLADLANKEKITLQYSDLDKLLTPLGFFFSPSSSDPDLIEISIPSWRNDIQEKVSLFGEIIRLYGQNRIQDRKISRINSRLLSESFGVASWRWRRQLRNTLISWDFHEVINYSFLGDDELERVAPGLPGPRLKPGYPETVSTLRSSILPSLFETALENFQRMERRIRIFEIGPIFRSTEKGNTEENCLGILIYGQEQPVSWNQNITDGDFFTLKKYLTNLFKRSRLDANKIEFIDNNESFFWPTGSIMFHPFRSSLIRYQGTKEIGVIGQLHPSLTKKSGFDGGELYYAEVRLESIFTKQAIPNLPARRPFPLNPVFRDLSFVFKTNIPAGQVAQFVRTIEENFISDVTIFDCYSLTENQKSLGLRLTIQPKDRNLKEDEITSIINRVVAAIGRQFSGQLRE